MPSTTAPLPIAIETYGDSAVMVTIEAHDADVRRRLIVAFRERVLARRPYAVLDVVAGLESLLIEFDALETSAESLEYGLHLLAEIETGSASGRPPVVLDVPFAADADTAPDLEEVAAELGIPPQEVLARIERSSFSVTLLAAAMAPMLSGLDVPAPVRRRAQPRTDVPAGSIMIAGENAIIQPFSGPTGWRVVGRTPLEIVDITRSAPVSYAPGDLIRFRLIDAAEAQGLRGRFLESRTEDER
ncbi:allophanate hydrolase subunit 1 [Rathayibacter sp. SD072]|uniref:5-oxoprolinase subunit B family protein n=1 Tax=Rathayibacter sp. SD072 TaxID=2781731 RepID=UPI001A97CB51|nr:carboxyltransferase domain-containing protein [Rathayibacter sp. SD072]